MRMYDQVLVDLLNLFVFGKYFFPLKEVVSVNELYNFGLRIFFFFGGGGGGGAKLLPVGIIQFAHTTKTRKQ